MNAKRINHIKNIILPCFLLSSLAGIFTGVWIFLFKLAAEQVIALSGRIYSLVRTEPKWLPVLLAGAATVGTVVWLLLRKGPNCRGGGIPTAVAILRGQISFHWIKSLLLLPASAMLTYLCGVPLGNEGPAVQMGTAMGRGTVRLFAPKQEAWDRYIMTGGACAGFAAATGAPVTGIFFAFEEAHRRFSPMIFMSAATAVIAGSTVTELLSRLTNRSSAMFHFSFDTVMPLQYLYLALLVGVICGLCAFVFTKAYRAFRNLIRNQLIRLPFLCKILLVFVPTALVGYLFADCMSSGHALIDALLFDGGAWYLLILFFLIRAALLLFANNIGVTGGLFIPQLTFGAILGSLVAQALIALGLLPAEFYTLSVIIGMTAFLGASSRTPITAILFSIEALSGLRNLLPIMVGVAFSFLVIETFGIPAFNDTVIEGKVEEENIGKRPRVVDAYLTVREGSFAVGKEIRDILWPPTCTVLSVEKSSRGQTHSASELAAEDVLHVHYLTHDTRHTAKKLESLVGKQTRDKRSGTHIGGKSEHIPEL